MLLSSGDDMTRVKFPRRPSSGCEIISFRRRCSVSSLTKFVLGPRLYRKHYRKATSYTGRRSPSISGARRRAGKAKPFKLFPVSFFFFAEHQTGCTLHVLLVIVFNSSSSHRGGSRFKCDYNRCRLLKKCSYQRSETAAYFKIYRANLLLLV